MEKEFILSLFLVLMVVFIVILICPKAASQLTLVNFSTDKQLYHSREKMKINAILLSEGEMENVRVKVFGIKRGNSYKLSQEKVVNLTKGKNEIEFSYVTPSCYGCAGIKPGKYDLTLEVFYKDKLILNSTCKIEIQP
jgi:hypothetical protein